MHLMEVDVLRDTIFETNSDAISIVSLAYRGRKKKKKKERKNTSYC